MKYISLISALFFLSETRGAETTTATNSGAPTDAPTLEI